MLSRSQQILLKRAQRQAGISDSEYRDTLQTVTGYRSSTAPALTDRHLDKLLAYFEALYWRAVDAGVVQPSCSSIAVFRCRGYWSSKNSNRESSRDRFTGQHLQDEISALESQLAALGFGEIYSAGIRAKVIGGRVDIHSQFLYRAALHRTLAAKAKALKQGASV